MHRVTLNEARLDLAITAVSPLCLPDVDQPERFVMAAHPADRVPSVYMPAGALKGLLRRAAEHILHSTQVDCCDVGQPCADRDAVKRAANTTADGAIVYRVLCAACKVFGSSVMRGHLALTDAFPAQPLRAARRHDVSADPVEVVQGETFYATLMLRNFERWQLGLLSLLMTRINLADVQIGAHRSAGMGVLDVQYIGFTLLYPGLLPDKGTQAAMRQRVHGVGQLMGSGNRYGFTYPDLNDMADLPDSAAFDSGLGYSAVVIPPPDEDEGDLHSLIDNTLTLQALAWSSYARAHQVQP